MRTFVQKNRYPLLLLVLVILLTGATLIRQTLAKHQQSAKLADSSRVAFFVGDPVTFQTLDDGNLTPGSTTTFKFELTNQKEGRQTEVATRYKIQLEDFGSLPIEYKLFRITDQGQTELPFDQFVELAAGTNENVIHQYELAINWPADRRNNYYQNDMKIQRLRIQTEQLD